jgi:NADP-dependent 3-hydroxy acid dehydrogenase YdfG
MSRVLITGASQGIGRATALELASRGHAVIATARRVEDLADLAVAETLQLDVTDQNSVDTAIAAAGDLDAIVSNAGTTIRGTVESIPLDEYRRLYEVNFLGALRVTKAVLPGFRERRSGRIIFVSSVLGRVAVAGVSAYAATKFALEAAAESLALETAHLGLRVSLLEPGPVATEGPSRAARYESPAAYVSAPNTVNVIAATGIIDANEVAKAVADTLEQSDPPLRIAVGRSAEVLIDAERRGDPTRPFDPVELLSAGA